MSYPDVSSYKSDSTQHSNTVTISSTTTDTTTVQKVSNAYLSVKWGGTAIWGSAFVASLVLFIVGKNTDQDKFTIAGTGLIVFAFFLLFLWGGIMILMRHKNEPCC